MIFDIAFIVAGLAALVFGGDYLVSGAMGFARKLGMAPAIVGVVVLGFGTSTPELFTSVTAGLGGQAGVALGNVVGSNIANVLLILGATALIAPVACEQAIIRRDGVVMMGVSVALVIALAFGVVPRLFGLALFLVLCGYLAVLLRKPDLAEAAAEDVPDGPVPGLPKSLLLCLIGLVLLVVGARLLVDGASAIALAMGVSEAIIGLTIVAIGTSLPELSASLTAAFRKQGSLAFGNVVGSNVFNIAGVLGLTAVITPLSVPDGIGVFDGIVMILASGVALYFGYTGRRIVRWEGVLLLGAYVAYIAATAA